MQNHNINSPDNLFLRGHASLRSKRPRLSGSLILLTLGPLLAVFLLLIGLGMFQLQRDIAAQADQTGDELTRQLATLVTDPLAANDTLSMNIILAQWTQSPLVAHASLTAANQRTVAEAGRKPSTDKLAPGKGRFSAMVHVQDEQIGELHLSLARAPFAAPATALVEKLLWALGLLALLACFIAWRVAVGMRRILAGIGEWYGDQGVPAPGIRRGDEIGDLARRLNERRITDLPPLPEPEPEPEPTVEPEPVAETQLAPAEEVATAQDDSPPNDTAKLQDAEADELTASEEPAAEIAAENQQNDEQPDRQTEQTPASVAASAPDTAVLAVRLGNQHLLHRLARPRLLGLLERYREQLEQASRACGGELHTLLDGTSLIFFKSSDDDQLGSALCCGELLRVLGHELQIPIADTGIAPHVQLALCHAECASVPPEELKTESPDCAQMFERMQHSRNLLLLDAELATSELLRDKVMVRRLASQPGTYCVERLRPPYTTLLEQHVSALGTHTS